MNITNAIDRFTRQLAANDRSVHTQAAYRRDLEGLGLWMGKKPDVGKVTPDLLARFLTSDTAADMAAVWSPLQNGIWQSMPGQKSRRNSR